MDIQTYQREARRTMPISLNPNEKLSMLCLGIAGESGEIIEAVKKDLYHGHFLDKKEVSKEIGDTFWYLANLATELNLSLENILDEYIEKLKTRYIVSSALRTAWKEEIQNNIMG
jgi:NTP pyrophosphatase (non-canonical NTP hydrolase)